MASTEFTALDIRRAVHHLLVRLAAEDAYTGSGPPPTTAQLAQSAETKMMTAYADTCRAADTAYASVVGHVQAQVRAAVAKAMQKAGGPARQKKKKRPRTFSNSSADALFEALAAAPARPTIAADNTVQVGDVRITLGARTPVILAYWDTLHAADAVYRQLSTTKPDATADDTVLHAHTVLIADPTRLLADAYTTMGTALEVMRGALRRQPKK